MFRFSGFQVFWLSVFPVSAYSTFWCSGSPVLDFRFFAFQIFHLFRFSGFSVFGFSVFWFSGFPVFRFSGISGSFVCDVPSPRFVCSFVQSFFVSVSPGSFVRLFMVSFLSPVHSFDRSFRSCPRGSTEPGCCSLVCCLDWIPDRIRNFWTSRALDKCI